MGSFIGINIAHAADSGIIRGLNEIIPGGFANILTFGIEIGGLIALIVIIYAGILYSMAGDNSSKQKEAREWIWAAVKGLTILISGYILITFINPRLLTIHEIDIPLLDYNVDVAPHYETVPVDDGSLGQPLGSIGIGGSVYGMRCHPVLNCCRMHSGVDLHAACNEKVYAVKSGKVKTLNDPNGYGKYIIITHDDGIASYYAHLNSYSVSNGERVDKGDIIGLAGNTGIGTGCHLHFEVRRLEGGNYVTTNVNLLFDADGKRSSMEARCPRGATCNRNQDCNGNPK